MRRPSALLLSLSLSLLCSCTNGGSTGTPGPVPGASVPAPGSNGANPSPSPTPAGATGGPGTASPTPGPGASATPGNPSSGSGLVQRLEIRLPSRFLGAAGETIKLEVLAFDAAGKPVDPGALSFTSSRPELISVDASGLVRALTDNGFAEIRVTAGGQTVTQLISVASGLLGGGGSGGGGGGTTPPTEEKLVGNVGFGFSEAPRLSSLSVTEGSVGSLLTLTGSGFRTVAADDLVLIGGDAATIVGTPTAESITVQVPAGDLGPQSVTITVGGQTSNALGFRRNLDEVTVNSYTTNFQANPDIAIDSDGDYVIVWQSQDQDGSSIGVYGQRFNAEGLAQDAEFRINVYTTLDQYIPSIAMAADGDFVVAWVSNGQDLSGESIYAQRYSATGQALGDAIQVHTPDNFDGYEPAIAINDAGEFVIAWGSSFAGNDIYAQRYDADGVAQGSAFRVNSYVTSAQISPAIAMDAVGNFIITWTSSSQDGDGTGIYAQRYTRTGQAQGGEFRVNSITTTSQSLSSIAMNAEGEFVIAWQSLDGNGNDIKAQRFDAAGLTQGNEFRVNTYTSTSQTRADLAINDTGDFVIAWQSLNQDGSVDGSYAQRFASTGVAQGGEFRVNTSINGNQVKPKVALAETGDFVITWYGSTALSDTLEILAKRYAPDGEAQ